MTVDQQKDPVRERVWNLLEAPHAAPPGVHGSIPAFFGASEAADRLAELPEWAAAQVAKAVPDNAQQPVRARVLRAGKLVYMAVPKLAEPKPFTELDPSTLAVTAEEAADKRTAVRVGRKVDVDEMRHVDLIICGSVAVNRAGVRLGKGAGYSDIEFALLQEAGLIGPETLIATTVHDLQVVDEDLPETSHDFSVDAIITPPKSSAAPHRGDRRACCGATSQKTRSQQYRPSLPAGNLALEKLRPRSACLISPSSWAQLVIRDGSSRSLRHRTPGSARGLPGATAARRPCGQRQPL